MTFSQNKHKVDIEKTWQVERYTEKYTEHKTSSNANQNIFTEKYTEHQFVLFFKIYNITIFINFNKLTINP